MRLFRYMTSKSFLHIFLSLLLVVLLMFTSNYIVFHNSLKSMYEHVRENNKIVVNGIIQSFDDSFRDMNNLIYAIHMLPDEARFSSVNNMYDVYWLQKELSTLVSSSAANEYIEEVVMFYPSSQLAITTAGTVSLDLLFRTKYQNNVYNSTFWKSLAEVDHSLRVFPASDYVELVQQYGVRARNLIVVAGNNYFSSRKNILVLVDVEKLLHNVDQKTMMKGTSLIVLDQDRNPILSTEKSFDLVDILRDVYLDPGRETTLQKQDYEYNLYQSDFNNFIYINKVPFQFANMKSVTATNRYIMYSTIILAVLLSGMLSYFLFRPVGHIVRMLGVGYERRGDFKKIQTSIQKIQDENEELRSDFVAAQTDIRRGLFLDALVRLPHTAEFDARIRGAFADLMEHRKFVIVLWQLQCIDPPADPSLSLDSVLAEFRLNLLEKWPGSVIVHVGGLRCVMLAGMTQKGERESLIAQLTSFAHRPGETVSNCCDVYGAISHVYDAKLENWQSAFDDAVQAFKLRNVDARGPIFDIEAVKYTIEVFFPWEKIEKLSNCLMSGNEQEAVELIDEWIQTNVDKKVHHHQLAYMAKVIYHHIMKQLPADDDEIALLARKEAEFHQRVDDSFDMHALRDELVRTAKVVLTKLKQAPKSKLDPTFISLYIELHYMESLYLDHMAEICETSPKYFSNYFKKTFGVNYVEYLNKVRLSHARKFLRNSDMSIAEIGEKIGYLNSSTFTTTFKKYYGISPSEFRKQALDEQA